VPDSQLSGFGTVGHAIGRTSSPVAVIRDVLILEQHVICSIVLAHHFTLLAFPVLHFEMRQKR